MVVRILYCFPLILSKPSSLFSLIGNKKDYFVTGDYEILKRSQQIEHIYNLSC
ncbi:MAG: hypothetical protein JXA54_07550 [Candidatus Heimdallarchaeota archaeon]|nr:hypothetical protein [Candidatus Heimdallarchaeota archaeon]